MQKNKTQRMVRIAMLTALSVVLMFFDFPLPFFPPFLKFDASDAIIYASSIFVGPWGMCTIILLRSLLYWFLKGAETGVPVGALATIISSTIFCLTTWFITQKLKNVQKPQTSIIIGLIGGTMTMAGCMFILNYFWITPFYFSLAEWPIPTNYDQYMLIYIPFNLIKGGLNSLLVYLLLPYMLIKKK